MPASRCPCRARPRQSGRPVSISPPAAADTLYVAVQLDRRPEPLSHRQSPAASQSSRGHLVVTYHYLRERNSDGVTALTPLEFKAHLAAIQKQHRVVSAEEFVAAREHEDRLALITFDDAVRDQYLAASILDDHRLPGVFFAPMRPFSDEADRWCSQHLLHALAEHLGWREFERRVEPHLRGVEIDMERMNQLYYYEAPAKRRLKFALAFALTPQRSWSVLREINATVRLLSEDWFMSRRQLAQLQDNGHCLGGHGFDHVPYTILSPDAQAVDMRRAVETMNALFGERPRPLAYPFGRCDATTEALARTCGYTMTFTTSDRVDAKFLLDELAQREQEDRP